MPGILIFSIILLIGLILILKASIVIVPQGSEYTIENLGKYTRLLKPGFHMLFPFIERIGARLNRMEQVMDVPSQEVITKDNAMVRVDGVVFFQIQDSARAAYQIHDLYNGILNLVMTNIRTVVGGMEVDELLSQRDMLNQRLLVVVDEATIPWGTKITRVEIKDISPPRDLIDAMARQMKAEREKRANILDAEGFKQAAILKADGEKQSAVLRAEGERQSRILNAEGEKQSTILSAEAYKEAAFRNAEAREREAAAEAKATKDVSDAIAKGDVQALNYFLGQKYVGALGNIIASPNQKLLMLPVETSGLMGSLAGIAEVAKEAFREREISEDKSKPKKK